MTLAVIRALAVCSAIIVSAGSQAAIINSLVDDFESESLALSYNSFSNWDVSNGTVDTVGPTFFSIDCQGSSVCVDLDGTSTGPGELSTKDSFAAGNYTVSFDLSGSQRGDTNTVTVTFGDLSEEFTLASDEPWSTITRVVNVAAPGNLTFLNSGSDDLGLLLDNVIVATVPVPAAAWLFVSALGLLGWFRRKPD